MHYRNGLTNLELIDGIGAEEISISGNRRAQLRFIREFDRREAWAHDGARHMGQWLAAHLGITVSEGLRRTKAAHALERLPLLSDALDRGALSFEKTCQLARYLDPESEADEIRWASKARFDQIKRKADVANRPTLDDVQADEVSRYLGLYECDELGSLGISGRLPAAEGALFRKAIEKMAATVPTMPDEEPDAERRNADALLTLTIGRAGPPSDVETTAAADPADDSDDDTDPDRATVVVHVDLDALITADRGGEIEGGPVIAPEIASELLCDCNLQMVVHDALDRAVGIGRESRIVPRWLRRQLMRRDRGCTFPGCGTRRFLQAHHIIFWEHGGPTQLDNLVMVCHAHHKLVHRFGWSVALDDHQVAAWSRPDGRSYEPRIRAPQATVQPEPVTLDPVVEADVSADHLIGVVPAVIHAERMRSPWVRAPGFG